MLEFRPYQRRFAHPVMTHHGVWQTRFGILVQITDQTQRIGYGEIAPIPWFGSETHQQAWELCQSLVGRPLSADFLKEIPPEFSACQFGLEVALENLSAAPGEENLSRKAIAQSALLPAGKAALSVWRSLYTQGSRTFKWKIGVAPLQEEISYLKALLAEWPQDCQLRLDANGGLTWAEAETWLTVCDAHAPVIEFVEQPLAIAEFDQMQTLSRYYQTPLALDESVATLAQLEACYQRGWRGVFVVKPAIAGSPSRLRQFCQQHALDVVCSTVFETAIGRRAGLQLAAELSHSGRAAGYRVGHWFDDRLDQDDCDPETVWQSC